MSKPPETELLRITIDVVNQDGVLVVDSDGNPALNSGCESLGRRHSWIALAIHDGITAYVEQGSGGDDGGGGLPCC